MGGERRPPQPLRPLEVAPPGDHASPPGKRVDPPGGACEHGVVQDEGDFGVSRPREHLRLGDPDVFVIRVEPAQPVKAPQRARQFAIPTVQRGEPKQRVLVQRIGGEDPLVSRARRRIVAAPECLVRLGQLCREQRRDRQECEHRAERASGIGVSHPEGWARRGTTLNRGVL